MTTNRVDTAVTAGIIGVLAMLAIVATAPREVKAQAGDRVAERETGRNWKASELIGLNVYTTEDEETGEIKDIVLSPDGRIKYAAVSFGGFLGMGNKLFAVPWNAVRLESKDGEANLARVDVTEESIKERQGFDQDHWPEEADRGFLAE
jgi:sporulation protein YlmC with PRC-barrel domain